MGTHALPAPVDDLRDGAEHHREWSKIRCARSLRRGLGKNIAEPSWCLQARRIWSRYLDYAGAALWLHPDGQQRDPDQLFLQIALRAGYHALSERDWSRPSGLRHRSRQAALARGSDLAGRAQVNRIDHGFERLSGAIFCDQRRVRAAGWRVV